MICHGRPTRDSRPDAAPHERAPFLLETKPIMICNGRPARDSHSDVAPQEQAPSLAKIKNKSPLTYLLIRHSMAIRLRPSPLCTRRLPRRALPPTTSRPITSRAACPSQSPAPLAPSPSVRPPSPSRRHGRWGAHVVVPQVFPR
jgi:hypothetical protein